MNYVSALLLHKMKFYADTSVPWEIIASLFLRCKHLLSKTPEQTLVKKTFCLEKKKLVGDFYVCNKPEKLFGINSINISFPVSRIDDIFLWGSVCVYVCEHVYVCISVRLLLMSRTSMFLVNFRQI